LNIEVVGTTVLQRFCPFFTRVLKKNHSFIFMALH